MKHTCAQAGCSEDATHLVIEAHPLAMLFRSGAGLACERHADDLAACGGVTIELAALNRWRCALEDIAAPVPTRSIHREDPTIARLRSLAADALRPEASRPSEGVVTHERAVQAWGPDPSVWPQWTCSSCGQLHSGWTLECGRCGALRIESVGSGVA